MRPALNQSGSINLVFHQLWKTNPTPYIHSNFISARNRAHSIIKNSKQNFIKKKCDDLSNNPSHSGHSQSKLLVTSITLHFPLSSVLMALLHLHQWIKQPSLLKNLSQTRVWTIPGQLLLSTYLFLIIFYPISFCLPEMFSQLLQF